MGLLDADFAYIPSDQTNVAATWRRFGYRPTTEAERRARQRAGGAGPAALERGRQLLPVRLVVGGSAPR